jgi:CheY-like chemotaxis protein
LAAVLAGSEFDTQVAADGLEALERLTTFNADVIVADLVMPRMDGVELLRHLKDHGDLTPAIALTGFGSIEKALSAIHDLKAFWFLEKPVEARPEPSGRTGRPGRRVPGDAADFFAHPAGGSHFSARIDPWRKRHREGVGRAGDP